MKISGFDEYIAINSFLYRVAVNEHEKCDFTISISPDDVSKYIGNVGKSCTVDNNDDSICPFSFTGTVISIHHHHTVYSDELEIHLEGHSITLDKEKKCRVFQNPEKKLSDIVESLHLSDVTFTGDKNDSAIKEIIVQEYETDWIFLLRMAKKFGLIVYPGEKVSIGDYADRSVNSITEQDIIDIKSGFFDKRKTVQCRLYKSLKFGNKVSYNGDEFVVDCIEYRKVNEQYQAVYYLEQHLPDIPFQKSEYYLHAIVTSNEDTDKMQKIQVTFKEPYQDVMKDNPIWINTYSFFATKDNGVSFLPEKDDEVIVHIVGDEAMVVSSVRTSALARLEDYNKKYLFLNNEKYFEFNNDEVIYDNKKCRCVISKDSMQITWDKNIEITIDDKKIYIKKDNNQVELSDEVKCQSDKIKMNSSKELSLTSSGNVNIKGTQKVSIN